MGRMGTEMEPREEILERLRRHLARRRLNREPLTAEESLAAIRRLRHLTQATVARRLETPQPEVCRLERRGDMRVSTLRAYVEALGGSLDLVARFPGLSFRITLRRP